ISRAQQLRGRFPPGHTIRAWVEASLIPNGSRRVDDLRYGSDAPPRVAIPTGSVAPAAMPRPSPPVAFSVRVTPNRKALSATSVIALKFERIDSLPAHVPCSKTAQAALRTHPAIRVALM